MKILLVEPGPSHSTIDVANGILAGLRDEGHPTGHYRLHNRIQHAGQCLFLRWEDGGSIPEQQPGINEIVFHASGEIVQYALYHEVDWVLYVSCGLVHDAVYKMLRRAGVPQAMILTESPYQIETEAETAQMVDVIWTNERTSVGDLRVACPRAFYLRLGYDPQIHKPRAERSGRWPEHDVVFVGTLWRERLDLLCSIDWSGIDLGIYGIGELLDLNAYPENQHYREYLEPYLHLQTVDEADTVELYGQAKIGINLHRTSMKLNGKEHVKYAESMNPRCYQQPATGGALLITDGRKEVVETLDAPIYHSAEELSEQMRYYLNHSAERIALVEHLRQQIAPHTYRERAAQVILDLQKGEARGD
jgi:hypothetical protein